LRSTSAPTDEEHEPFSLEAQRSKLESYVGIQPERDNTGLVFRDEASGATTDRKHLQRARLTASSNVSRGAAVLAAHGGVKASHVGDTASGQGNGPP
jgi:hypothetical protein